MLRCVIFSGGVARTCEGVQSLARLGGRLTETPRTENEIGVTAKGRPTDRQRDCRGLEYSLLSYLYLKTQSLHDSVDKSALCVYVIITGIVITAVILANSCLF